MLGAHESHDLICVQRDCPDYPAETRLEGDKGRAGRPVRLP